MAYQSIPATVMASYSELLSALLTAPLSGRGISYVTRPSKGRRYWYLQYVIGPDKRSYYLGPDSAEMRELIEKARQLLAEDAADQAYRERLVNTLVAGGLQAPTATEGRVYEALSQAGVFEGGGVLVGSHAFVNIGNMLGVRWSKDLIRTADIDIARDPHFLVGLNREPQDLEQHLRESNRAFFAVPALDHRQASTRYRIRGQELSVSLLAPMLGKETSRPVPITALKAAAEPVRYLDYVIENSQLVAVPVKAGVLIRVPDPARFALHKLVVSQRRPVREAAKSRKDIQQAEAVLEVLRDLRPGDIRNARAAAETMGEKFMEHMREAARILPDELSRLLA